jgi:hypothetical protein
LLELEEVAEIACDIITGAVRALNGCASSSMAKYNPELVPAGLDNQARWLPTRTNKEKGIRNFTEAANQSWAGFERLVNNNA